MSFKKSLPVLRTYGLAVLLVFVALGVRLALTALIGLRYPLLLFILAIMTAARFGGRGPGLLATFLSTYLIWYFLLPPRFSFDLQGRAELVNLIVFLVVGAGISLTIGQLHQARIVSERSREALLRHTELLDKAREPIFSWKKGGIIQYWNVGAENLYGFTKQEALGRAAHELLQTYHPLGVEEIEQLVLADGSWRGELIHKAKDGRTIVVQGVMTAVNDPDEERSVIETNHDITDRKESEAALIRVNEDLRQFAYAASHDLQEPLRNISLTLDLLRHSYQPKLERDGLNLIDESIRGARRMHRMLKDLLSFTKIGSLEEDVTVSSLDCNEIVREALDNLKLVILERSARIETESLPSIQMQRAHLLQLFQNLVGNALKYSKPGEQPRIVISAERKDGEWIFKVVDNGIGFDQAYAERIFGIFKRLHPSYEYEGTGIGLAICARIVSLYRGRIWAESRVGEGATFSFCLPVEGAWSARDKALGATTST